MPLPSAGRVVNLYSAVRRLISLRVAFALGVGIVSAGSFLAVSDAVREGEATEFDRSISAWLHRFDSPAIEAVMHAITLMGSAYFLAPLICIVGIWACVRRRPDLAEALVAVSVTAEALNVVLKHFFHRPRPTFVAEIERPDGYSFPSGHSMASVVVFGMVAFVIGRLCPRVGWPFYFGSGVLVLLIGVSRALLGVHWPTDVLAGFAAGAIVLAAVSLSVRCA